MIFVFGSNESGIHGAGAARTAFNDFGAEMGKGFGKAGKSFAIPTKDWKIGPLPLDVIEHYVNRFIVFARMSPNAKFKITAIGTGLAGILPSEMARLFKYAPENCLFDSQWEPCFTAMHQKKNYWGTF